MKYKTIVIDPPWDVNICVGKQCKGSPNALPYKTMTDDQIYNFNIHKIADEECNLFLWTIKSKIHTSFHILTMWGFRYTNLIVWNKRSGINNNGFCNTLEYMLHGYMGKNNLDFTTPLPTYFMAKRRKHSQKPDLFYSMLRERTLEPRIDIFARKRHYGFDAWGDQVETHEQKPLLS